MAQNKMYTLFEAFSLVGKNKEAVKVELKKSHSCYLNEEDVEVIMNAIDMDPERADSYLAYQDTIVREAAVVSILVALKIEG